MDYQTLSSALKTLDYYSIQLIQKNCQTSGLFAIEQINMKRFVMSSKSYLNKKHPEKIVGVLTPKV